MKNKSNGTTVIYFNDESKNIYANLPPDKETAKKLSKRIFQNAMTALCAEQQKQSILLKIIYTDNEIST